jgi:hypothetical protein
MTCPTTMKANARTVNGLSLATPRRSQASSGSESKNARVAAHVAELVDVALPGAFVGRRVRHRNLLVEARKRRVETAGEPERARHEQPLAIVDVREHLANAPLVSGMATPRVFVGNRRGQRQHLGLLLAHEGSNVVTAYSIDIREVVRCRFMSGGRRHQFLHIHVMSRLSQRCPDITSIRGAVSR